MVYLAAMSSPAYLSAVIALSLLSLGLGAEKSLYDLTAMDATGSTVSLNQYGGKVSLVVNVASQCGYTDLNYRELVKMQQEFSEEDFSILAFPCNQFGKQEPGTMSEILEFTSSYGINFPLFSKVDVVGQGASDVYSFLYEVTRTQPKWNFGKFLVDRRGRVRQFFSEKGDFSAIRQAVRYQLDKPHTEL